MDEVSWEATIYRLANEGEIRVDYYRYTDPETNEYFRNELECRPGRRRHSGGGFDVGTEFPFWSNWGKVQTIDFRSLSLTICWQPRSIWRSDSGRAVCDGHRGCRGFRRR